MNIIENKKYIFITLSVLVLVVVLVLIIRGIGNQDKNTGYSIILPEIYTNALSIQTAQGYNFSVRPALAKEVEKKEKKNITTYKDAYEQSDVVFTVGDGKLKEDIVLKAPGHPLEFSFQINMDNFWYEVNSTGDFVFYPKKNNELGSKFFTIPAPFMIDAKGMRSSDKDLQAKITDEGKFIITLSEKWLASAQYPVTIDPTIQIQILNIHSSPQLGEEWRVQFTTLGRSDLKIIPETQATIDDDEFVSLACDGRILKPQILENDIIFYPNWQCDGVGEVVHFTNLAGKHTLRFEYAGQTQYAYNSDWWNNSWTKRKKIMLDTTTTATTSALTNYPLPVLFNSDRIDYTNTKNNGEDIRFVDPDGTVLNYEIEKWNESGTSTVWVKVPTISANSASDYIYVYYGNTTASDNSTTTGVWDANYVGVYHFDETSGDQNDSTTYGNVFYDANTTVTAQGSAPGKLDGANEFDDIDDSQINDDADQLDGATTLTVEFWINFDSVPLENDIIFEKDHTLSPGYAYAMWKSSTNNFFWVTRDEFESLSQDVGDTTIVANQWYYVVGTANTTDGLNLYVNGIQDDPTPDNLDYAILDTNNGIEINGTSGNKFNGLFDEFRLSNTTRSLGWIQFSYCSMSDSCVSYASSEESIDWWNSAWKYRRKISFNTTTSATTTNLADFPVAVQLNSTRIDYDLVQNAGEDIRFVDGDEELPYEIEKWDEAGTSTIWVKVPQVDASSTADHIWMYYGNSNATDNQDAVSVWSDYIAVWHLNESTGGAGAIKDATGNGHNGTDQNAPTFGVTGKVGSAITFNGTDEYITVSDATGLNGMANLTISGWVNDSSSDDFKIIGKWSTLQRYYILREVSGAAQFYISTTSAGQIGGNIGHSGTDGWSYYAGTYDGSTMVGYKNGIAGSTTYNTTGSINNSTGDSDLIIGADYNISNYSTETADEIRITDLARSGQWLAFEYCNMNDTCSTYSARENYADTTWWNSEWTRRRKISFDTTTSATTTALTDSPVVVQFNSARIDYDFTQNAGQDIRFIDADGLSQLSYEIEKWNESGTSTVWVKVPSIDKNSNADFIYVYYGNSFAQDNQKPQEVWTNGFSMVQHLNNTTIGTDAFVDSTSYDNDGTGVDAGSSLQATTGKLDGAFVFDGSDDNVEVADSNSLDGIAGLTMSGWIYFNQLSSTLGRESMFLAKRHSADPWNSYYFDIIDTGGGCPGPDVMYMTIKNEVEGADYKCANTSMVTSTWYYVATTWDGSDVHFYLNGANDDYSATSFTGNSVFDSDGILHINGDDSAAGRIAGLIDEVRISKVARSADWMKFEYCNMNGGCTSYATEETAGNPPTISSISFTGTDPLNTTSTAIDLSMSFQVNWNDEDVGEQVKALVCKPNDTVGALNNDSGDSGGAQDPSTFADANYVYIGNYIQPTVDRTIGGTGIYFGTIDGTISGLTFYSEVWTLDGSDNLDTLIATSQPKTGLGTGWNTFVFNSEITLEASVEYAIVFRRSDTSYDAVNHPRVPYDDINWTTGEGAWSYAWTASGTYFNNWTNEWPVRLYDFADVLDVTTLTCNGGSWASSTSFTTADPISFSYTPVPADLGSQSYYIYVCDDSYSCSQPTSGSFYVYAPVYRSMGYNNTNPLVTSGGNNLTILGSSEGSYYLASFDVALPDIVGVGDAIQYDSDSNSSIDKIVFIHRRISPTQYIIRPATGTTTPSTVFNDTDWSIYRSYTSITYSEYGTENTGINATVRNFDAFTAGTNLVTSNLQWNIPMYADAVASTTAANFTDTWVTSQQNYLRLYTPVYEWEVGRSQRHHGYMTDTAFKVFQESTANYQRSIDYETDYMWIDGLQFELWNRGGYSTTYSLYPGNASTTWISNNIFKGDPTDPDVDYGAMKYTGTNTRFYIWNNIFYDYYNATSAFGQNAVEINTETASGVIANNTCVRVSDQCYGWRLINFKVMNNIAQQAGDGFASLGGFSANTDYNISSNSSDVPGSHSKNSTSVTFSNPGVKDYRLHSSDNQAKDEGYDFSADTTFVFSTDIEGESRTGEWDIGADEIPLTTPIYLKGDVNVKGGLYVK